MLSCPKRSWEWEKVLFCPFQYAMRLKRQRKARHWIPSERTVKMAGLWQFHSMLLILSMFACIITIIIMILIFMLYVFFCLILRKIGIGSCRVPDLWLGTWQVWFQSAAGEHGENAFRARKSSLLVLLNITLEIKQKKKKALEGNIRRVAFWSACVATFLFLILGLLWIFLSYTAVRLAWMILPCRSSGKDLGKP